MAWYLVWYLAWHMVWYMVWYVVYGILYGVLYGIWYGVWYGVTTPLGSGAARQTPDISKTIDLETIGELSGVSKGPPLEVPGFTVEGFRV